jgi:SAM-dependent methyltransferase
MAKLNIGCGQYPKPGYVNVDADPAAKADVFHNLDVFPYPFEENSFDEITADHCLEHLKDPFAVMKELKRIAKPGAEIIIRVPHFSRGFTHADHKRGFDFTFPYYFNPSFLGGYSGTHIGLKSMRLRWFAQQYLKKTILNPVVFGGMATLGFVFDLLANLSPALCSRLWCFWVGGFEEIEYHFVKPAA